MPFAMGIMRGCLLRKLGGWLGVLEHGWGNRFTPLRADSYEMAYTIGMKANHLDQKLLNFIISKAKEGLRARRVILFGSRAKGTSREHSDYDLAFDIPQEISHEDWAAVSVHIQEEAPTLLNLDLVNLNEIDETFKMKILHEGVVIYEGNDAKSN